jgi:hypothetical protein
MDTGVAILPGADFERPLEELAAHLAYVNFDGAQVLAASKVVPLNTELPDDFLSTHCPDTIEAMKLIAEWANS